MPAPIVETENVVIDNTVTTLSNIIVATEIMPDIDEEDDLVTNEKLPSKILETRDSISSIDSDVSLSFDNNTSKCQSSDVKVIENSVKDNVEKNSGIVDENTDENDAVAVINDDNNRRNEEEEDRAHMADLSDSCSDNGGKDSGCEITSELQEPPFQKPDDELADRIVQQVEFYFSDASITKDAFLLKHVKRNKEGYVSLKLISSFKRVKHITKDWRVVAYALKRSTKLQINESGTKLRRIDPLPKYDETTPSRTVVAVNMPIEKPTIENVAELFKNCGEISLIRILRPGNPIPADVRQFINKNPSLNGQICSLIEFVQSESARRAIQMTNDNQLDNAQQMKVYELNGVPHTERKKKNKKTNNANGNVNSSSNSINSKNCNQGNGVVNSNNYCNHGNHNNCNSQIHHHHNHHIQSQCSKQQNKLNCCHCCLATNNSCFNENLETTTHGDEKFPRAPPRCLRRGFSAHFPSKTLEPAAWLQRRLSASSTEANFIYMPRRLSYGNTTNLNSTGSSSSNSRDSSDLNISRRVSSGSLSSSIENFNYCHNSNVINSNCHYFNRRMSSSCGSNQSISDNMSPLSSPHNRSRSNSSAFQQNENVVRLPRGPDGSKGFRQRPSNNNNNQAIAANN